MRIEQGIPSKTADSRKVLFPSNNGGRSRIFALVADHDPLSRRVLGDVLRRGDRLDVVACIDSHDPIEEWPLKQAKVVVLGANPDNHIVDIIRKLTARMVAVLLIGTDWTRATLDAALGAGASGCLAKDAELNGLITAVEAVASGNIVLSHGPLELYIPHQKQVASRTGRALSSLTDREHQILVLLANGVSTAEAAKTCGVSTATIKSHVSHALTKLGVRNRLEAVLMVKGVHPSLAPQWHGPDSPRAPS